MEKHSQIEVKSKKLAAYLIKKGVRNASSASGDSTGSSSSSSGSGSSFVAPVKKPRRPKKSLGST